jgi:hypothetical protein
MASLSGSNNLYCSKLFLKHQDILDVFLQTPEAFSSYQNQVWNPVDNLHVAGIQDLVSFVADQATAGPTIDYDRLEQDVEAWMQQPDVIPRFTGARGPMGLSGLPGRDGAGVNPAQLAGIAAAAAEATGAAATATEQAAAAEVSAAAAAASATAAAGVEVNVNATWVDVEGAYQEIQALMPTILADRNAAQDAATAAQTAATQAQGFAPDALIGRVTALEQQVQILQSIVTQMAAFVGFNPPGPI